jgi:hypothetical protein
MFDRVIQWFTFFANLSFLAAGFFQESQRMDGGHGQPDRQGGEEHEFHDELDDTEQARWHGRSLGRTWDGNTCDVKQLPTPADVTGSARPA